MEDSICLASKEVPQMFRGMHALVVDHDATTLMNLSSKLEEQSYRGTIQVACTICPYILGLHLYELK